MQGTRRTFAKGAMATAAAALLPLPKTWAQSGSPMTRPIPSTGERLPAVGLGTWITSTSATIPSSGTNAPRSWPPSSRPAADDRLLSDVRLLAADDRLWPRQARPAAGRCSRPRRSGSPPAERAGQIERSRAYWGVPRFDLLQVHNLLSWKAHLQTLFDMKAAGQVRYVGITTSEGRRHDISRRSWPPSRSTSCRSPTTCSTGRSKERILPLARDRGIAVIVNRPFREGHLIRQLERQPLPHGRRDGRVHLGAVPPEIHRVAPGGHLRHSGDDPVDHVRENMAAATGILPDEAMRRRMADMWGGSDVGVVDLRAPGLPALLPARLLADVRAAQRGGLAVATPILLLGAAILAGVVRPRPWSDRVVSAGLAAAWIWVAWASSGTGMPRSTGQPPMLPGFRPRGAAGRLVRHGPGRLRFAARRSVPSVAGLALFLYALVLHPLVPKLSGRPIQSAEVFGIAPDPTAIATLGPCRWRPRGARRGCSPFRWPGARRAGRPFTPWGRRKPGSR